MRFKTYKPFIIIIAFILCLTLTVALIASFWPKYEDQFFEFGLLGKDKRAEAYYPNDNSTLILGSQLNWYIFIHNHMGSDQNVVVKVKLVNSSVDLEIDQHNEALIFDSLVEFPLQLPVNNTLLMPFSWTVVEARSQENSIILKQLIINDQVFDVDIPAVSNSFFRMVFELWVYDSSSESYAFGWTSQGEFHSAQFYIGFRISQT